MLHLRWHDCCSEPVNLLALCTRRMLLCRAPDGPINVPSSRLEMNARVAAAVDAPVLMVLDAPSDLTLEVRPRSRVEHAMELWRNCDQIVAGAVMPEHVMQSVYTHNPSHRMSCSNLWSLSSAIYGMR